MASGPVSGPVGSITGLPAVARYKLGTRAFSVNTLSRAAYVSPTLSLIIALISLIIWVMLTFVTPLGVGLVHVLLGLGVTLLVRWWALRSVDREP